LEAAGASPLDDEALEACLIAAGAARLSAASLRSAECDGAGIRSLHGIEAYPALRVLDLSRNRVSDLAPLAALTDLQALALAGNAVADLTPLAGLPALRRLSLAQTTLGSAQTALLATLSDRLTRLDLSGATGLSPESVQQLKQALPATVVITPDGAVLP
jgi:internalin A